MQDIINSLRQIFPFIAVWFPQRSKVDKAISGITGAVEQLNDAAKEAEAKSSAAYDVAFAKIDEAQDAHHEARRAERLSHNLNKLVQ